MPKSKDNWVKLVNRKMDELVDDVRKERQAWSDEVEETYGYYMSDRSVIFAEGAQTSEQRRAPDALAQYHIPLTAEKVDAMVAATNSPDIKIRYVPKLDQDVADEGVVDLARQGTALFEAHRTYIGWDTHMQELASMTAVLDHAYLALYVDSKKSFPVKRADMYVMNPWQVFSTPGVRLRDASEVVTARWIEKDELRAQYPEFSDEIAEVKVSGADTDAEENQRDALAVGDTVPWEDGIPGYGGTNVVVSKSAVIVRERWKFDPSLDSYSREESEREMELEHALIDMAIERGDPSMLPPDPTLSFKTEQYHTEHSPGHWEKVLELRARRDETQTMKVMSPYDSVVTEYEKDVLDATQKSIVEQGLMLLEQHAEMHDAAAAEIQPGLEGKYPRYDGGWRHSIVIGNNDNAIGVYDGYSRFLDFGIQGPPIYAFRIRPRILHNYGPSYASMIVDENKLLDSFINSIKDNFVASGSNTWAMEQSILDAKETHISQDPRVPTKFPDGTMSLGKAQQIQGMPAPPVAMPMIQLVLGLAEQTSGIFGSVRGSRQTGVRSGEHEQFLAERNMGQLQQYQRLWKNQLEEFCIDLFKLMLAVPPDDRYVKPMIDNRVVDYDIDTLRNVDFAIEVVMTPGGSSSTEDRASITLGFLQNAFPIFKELGLTSLLVKFLADSVKLTMPDIAAGLQEAVAQVEQREQQQAAMMQQMQQQAAQTGQGAAPPGMGA